MRPRPNYATQTTQGFYSSPPPGEGEELAAGARHCGVGERERFIQESIELERGLSSTSIRRGHSTPRSPPPPPLLGSSRNNPSSRYIYSSMSRRCSSTLFFQFLAENSGLPRKKPVRSEIQKKLKKWISKNDNFDIWLSCMMSLPGRFETC